MKKLSYAVAPLVLALWGSGAAGQTGEGSGKKESGGKEAVVFPEEFQEDLRVPVVLGPVAGSHIDSLSELSVLPLTVLGPPSLEAGDSLMVAEALRALPFVSGNPGFSGISPGSGGGLGLHSLGGGSTLVLLNGRRMLETEFDEHGGDYADLASLAPDIALKRVEAVRAGAFAAYGSGADAGALNFVTRDDFVGLETRLDYEFSDVDRSRDDIRLSALGGVANERLHLLIAASYLRSDPLAAASRYDDYGRSVFSFAGPTGNYAALGEPQPRGSYFGPPSQSGFGSPADLDCLTAASVDGIGRVLGLLDAEQDARCVTDLSSAYDLVRERTEAKIYVAGRYQWADDLELRAEISYSGNHSEGANVLLGNPGPVILGADHPGVMLDAQRRGIAPVPYLGYFQTVSGRDDVTSDRDFFRIYAELAAKIPIAQEYWSFHLGITWADRNSSFLAFGDTLAARAELAYQGLGGGLCVAGSGSPGSGNLGTGNCYYYNPFATSYLDPVTGERWDREDDSSWAADSSLSVAEAARKYGNSDELSEWLRALQRREADDSQLEADFRLSGSLFGALRLAFGMQLRREQMRVDWDDLHNAGGYSVIHGARDFSGTRNTLAAYSELSWRPFSWLNLAAAGRLERYGITGDFVLNPMAGIFFRPLNGLVFRGFASTASKQPSIVQARGTDLRLSRILDPDSAPDDYKFVPVIWEGNSNLQPETSASYGGGITLSPTGGDFWGGLTLSLDVFRSFHEDLIVAENPAALLSSATAPTAEQIVRGEDGGVERILASYRNAPEITVSGLELDMRYQFGFGRLNRFALHFSLLRLVQYDFLDAEGNRIDALGKRNAGSDLQRAVPETKASLDFYWSLGHNLLVASMNYVGGYENDQPLPAVVEAYAPGAGSVGELVSLDIQYSFKFPRIPLLKESPVIAVGVKNFFDKSPSSARALDGGYDPEFHAPQGRTWYLRYRMNL